MRHCDRPSLERPMPARPPAPRSHLTSTTKAIASTASPASATTKTTPGGRAAGTNLRRVDVSVMGLTLGVRTDREDAWIHGIAGLVNRRAEELRRAAKNANPQQLAVLVALNLAEDLQTERERAAAPSPGTRSPADAATLEALAQSALARVQEALAAIDDDDDDDRA
jgi:cell division protein ZapA (FtsZ GTPase activity inhibitor)